MAIGLRAISMGVLLPIPSERRRAVAVGISSYDGVEIAAKRCLWELIAWPPHFT